jgi:peptidyl-prolyl cis-trans isomerase A (cyclophilin A)
MADIETSLGTLTCELRAKEAPNTVANFVGLARGKRPFLDPRSRKWASRPFYDGLTFHRVIPGFMIQGGDLLGDGTGQPGYTIPSEANNGLLFDKPGRLAMARRSDPNSAGAQFFVTDGEPSHLNGAYTIFGDCTPTAVVTTIANVAKDARDKPLEAVLINRVTVKRR